MTLTTDVYNAWSLVLQLLVGAAMVATFVVYYLQLRAMRLGAVGENILSLVNFLQAQHVREARTIVRRDLKGRAFSAWTDAEKRAADLVSSTYEVAAILILQQRLVPVAPFLPHWGSSIRDCYEILHDYIKDMQRTAGAEYWSTFNAFYLAAGGRALPNRPLQPASGADASR